MSERMQTLMACDVCGRGYPARELLDCDGESLVCADCAKEGDEQRHDCDREYRSDCARCNGVAPGDVGTW